MNGNRGRRARTKLLLVMVAVSGAAALAAGGLLQLAAPHPDPAVTAATQEGTAATQEGTAATQEGPATDGTATEGAVTGGAAPAGAVTLTDLRAMVSGPDALTISILGDSTGDEPGEWVDLWARDLSVRGTVTVHFWDGAAAGWKPDPIVYPGPDRAIIVWNGSRAGASYGYPLEHLHRIQPSRPSLTVLNFGHNPYPDRADEGAAVLLAASDAKWSAAVPAAIVLQNPSLGLWEEQTAGSVSALRGWAPGAGYPVIDVNAAYRARGGLADLLADDVHPNSAGQRLWADTVRAALG